MRGALCVGIVCVFVAGAAGGGFAGTARQPQVRDPAREKQYVVALEEADPKLAALFREGTEALDAGRFQEARDKFERVLLRVRDHAPTLRRLSYAIQASGDAKHAVELARRAREVLPGHEGDFA